MGKRSLDLGCGQKKYPGAIGADLNRRSHADVICHLGRYPYPFRPEAFDLIVCDNLVEHLEDISSTLREIHRILKTGGELLILSPHFSSDDSYSDVTHRHSLSLRVFDEFLPGRSAFDYYVNFKFDLIERRICFGRLKRLFGIERLANRFSKTYETHLAFILQAHHIQIRLRKIK